MTGRHSQDCACSRCKGFAAGNDHGLEQRFDQGNDAAVTHGAYSPGMFSEAAQQEYATLRETLVLWDPVFEIATRTLAEARARRRLVNAWLDEVGFVDEEGNVRPIVLELPKWDRRETELLREMAATVRSRVELDIDRLARERGMIEIAEVNEFSRLVMGVCNEFVPEHRRTEFVLALKELAARERALGSGRSGDA